jgi:hypothetical protein
MTAATLSSSRKITKKATGAEKKSAANHSAVSKADGGQIPRKRKATEDIPIPTIEATEPKSKRAKTSHTARKGKHKNPSPSPDIFSSDPDFDLIFSGSAPFGVDPAVTTARELLFKAHVDYCFSKYRFYPAPKVKQFWGRRLGAQYIPDPPATAKKRSTPAPIPPRPRYEYVDTPSAPSGDTGAVDSSNIIESKRTRTRKASSRSISKPAPARIPRPRKAPREQTTRLDPAESDTPALPPILESRPLAYPGEEREPLPSLEDDDGDGFSAPTRNTTVRTDDGRECYVYSRSHLETGVEEEYWILLKGRRPG